MVHRQTSFFRIDGNDDVKVWDRDGPPQRRGLGSHVVRGTSPLNY